MSRIQAAIIALVAVVFAVFGTALTVEAQLAPAPSQQVAAAVGFFVTSFVLLAEAIARFPRITNPAIRLANSVKRIANKEAHMGKQTALAALITSVIVNPVSALMGTLAMALMVLIIAVVVKRVVKIREDRRTARIAAGIANLHKAFVGLAQGLKALRLARRNCWSPTRLQRYSVARGLKPRVKKPAAKAAPKPAAKAPAKPAPAPALVVEVSPITEVAVEAVAKPAPAVAKPAPKAIAKPVAKAAVKPAAKFPRVTKAQVFAAHIAAAKAKQVTVKPVGIGAKIVVTKTTLAQRIEDTVSPAVWSDAEESAKVFTAITAIEDAKKRTRLRELARQRRNAAKANAIKASSPVLAVLAAAAPTFIQAVEAAWARNATEFLMGPGFLVLVAIASILAYVMGNTLGKKLEARVESFASERRLRNSVVANPRPCAKCGVMETVYFHRHNLCDDCEKEEFRLYAGLPTPEGWDAFLNEIGNDLVEAVSSIFAEAISDLDGEAQSANDTTNASVKPGIILASTKHTGAPTPKEKNMGNKKIRVATPGTFAAFLEEACATSPAADDSPGLLDGLVVADDDANAVANAKKLGLVSIRVLQKGMTLYCTPEAKAVSVAALRFKGKTLGRIAKYADSYWISRVTARVVLPGKVLDLGKIAAALVKYFDGLVLVRSDVAKAMGLTAPMVARILTHEGLIKGMCIPLPKRYFPEGVCVITSEVKTEWSATQNDYALCWIPGTAALTKEKAVMSLQSILMLLGAEVNSKEFYQLIAGYIAYAKKRLPDFLKGLDEDADDFVAGDEEAKVEDNRNATLAKLLGAMRIPVLPFRMLAQQLVGTLSKNIEAGSMKIVPATEEGSDLWATYPIPVLWPMIHAAWVAEGQHSEEVATKAAATAELETKTADGRLIVYCTNFARWAKNNCVPNLAIFFRNPTGETSGTVAEIRELPESLNIFIIGVSGRMVQMLTTVSEDTRIMLLLANEGMDYDDRCPTARGKLAMLIVKGLAWRTALANKAKANAEKRAEKNALRAKMVAGIPKNKSLWTRLNAATILGQAFKVKTENFVITAVEEPEAPVEATTAGMSHESLYESVMDMEENVFQKAIGIVANAKIYGMALAVGWVKLPDFLEELREEISETLLFGVILSDIVDAAVKMAGYAEAWASYRMVQVYQVWLDLVTEGKGREGWAFVPAVLRKLSLGAKSLFVDPARRVAVLGEDMQPLVENGVKVTAPVRDAEGNIVTHLVAGELTSKVYTLWAEYRQWCIDEVEILANAQWNAGRQNVLHQTLTAWLGRTEDEAPGEENLAWLFWNWDAGYKNLQAWTNQELVHKIMAPAGAESNRRHRIVSAMLAGGNVSRAKKAFWLAYSAMPIRLAIENVGSHIESYVLKNFNAEDRDDAVKMAWLAFANRYLMPAEKGKKVGKNAKAEALEITITEDANGNLKANGGIATTAFFVGGPWEYLTDWMSAVGVDAINSTDDNSLGEARTLALYMGKGGNATVRQDAEALLAFIRESDNCGGFAGDANNLGYGIDGLLSLPGVRISDGRDANGFEGQLPAVSEIGRQIELRRKNKAEQLRKALAEAKNAKKPSTSKIAEAQAELDNFNAMSTLEAADSFGFLPRLTEIFPGTAVKAELVEREWVTEWNPDIKTKDENGNTVMGRTVAVGTTFMPQGLNTFLVLTFLGDDNGPQGGNEEDLNDVFSGDEPEEDTYEEGYEGEPSYEYDISEDADEMPEPEDAEEPDFGDENPDFDPNRYGNEEEECMSPSVCEVCEGAGCRICTNACEDCKVEGDFVAGLCPACEARYEDNGPSMAEMCPSETEEVEAEETEHFFVAFTGHRPDKIGGYNPNAPKRIWVREQIQAQLERGLAKHGEKLWVITGGALGVDQDAAEIAYKMGIPFTVMIPCVEQEAMWPREAKQRYWNMLDVASEVVQVSDKAYSEDKFCMQRRNMEMIDCADIVIAVWDGSTGGTKNAVDYAEESGLKIIFIDPNDFDAEVEVEEKPAPAVSQKKVGIAARLNRITGKK